MFQTASEWIKTHSQLLLGFLAVLAFVFWKVLINFPVWALGKMLAHFYSSSRLSNAMEVSSAGQTHVTLAKPPGRLPSVRNLTFKVVNTLRFLDVEIRRADVDVGIHRQEFISRDRFIGEIVKSTRNVVIDFNIDLDELRVTRVKDFLSPQASSITLTVKLTMQCATFFRKFDVIREFEILANVYL